jgi:hypothetical protein
VKGGSIVASGLAQVAATSENTESSVAKRTSRLVGCTFTSSRSDGTVSHSVTDG